MKAHIANNAVTQVQPDDFEVPIGEASAWVAVVPSPLRADIFDKDWSGRTVPELINAMYKDLFHFEPYEVQGNGSFAYKYDAANNVAAEVMDAAPILPRKLKELADYRWTKETGGTTLMGMVINTDENSQQKVTGARVAANADPTLVIDWKAENGWVQLNAQIIVAISDAVRAHVQACFTNEKAHYTAMSAIKDAFVLMQYDFTTGWP